MSHLIRIYTVSNSTIFRRAYLIQWLRALTLKHWISHHCGSSLTPGTCEMPSSAPVGRWFFSGHWAFCPPLINDQLDISEIFLKGP